MISGKKQKLCSSLYSTSFTNIFIKDDKDDKEEVDDTQSANPKLRRTKSIETYCNPMYYRFMSKQKMGKKSL